SAFLSAAPLLTRSNIHRRDSLPAVSCNAGFCNAPEARCLTSTMLMALQKPHRSAKWRKDGPPQFPSPSRNRGTAREKVRYIEPYAEHVRRIRVLMGWSDDAVHRSYFSALIQELARLGWSDGDNARIVLRWTDANIDHARGDCMDALARRVLDQLPSGTSISRGWPHRHVAEHDCYALRVRPVWISDSGRGGRGHSGTGLRRY